MIRSCLRPEGSITGTVRGRIGFLILPTLLVYGTGGLAYGQANSSNGIVQLVENDAALPNPFASFGRFSHAIAGWTAGGGLEWLFYPNWSLKVEYLYYDLGHVNYLLSPLTNINAAGEPFTGGAPVSGTRFNGNIVRAGLNYHFNWEHAGTGRRKILRLRQCSSLSEKLEPGREGRVFPAVSYDGKLAVALSRAFPLP